MNHAVQSLQRIWRLYSNQCNAFFCNPSCATNYYFEYMGSTTVDLTDGDGLIEQGIEIVDGKLVKLED